MPSGIKAFQGQKRHCYSPFSVCVCVCAHVCVRVCVCVSVSGELKMGSIGCIKSFFFRVVLAKVVGYV